MKRAVFDYVVEYERDWKELGVLIRNLNELLVDEVQVQLKATPTRMWPEVSVLYDEEVVSHEKLMAVLDLIGHDMDSVDIFNS